MPRHRLTAWGCRPIAAPVPVSQQTAPPFTGFIADRRHPPPSPGHDRPNDRLTASRHRDVLHDHALLPTFALQLRHRRDLLGEQAHEPHRPKDVPIPTIKAVFRLRGVL
jgi:hypothetical protein